MRCFLTPGASTGGTDIAAMILKKYAKIDIGKALFLVDAVIAVTAGLVFGIETGLFSCLGLIAKAFFVDSVIESINTSKYFTIVTENPEPLLDFIMKELHRGATESTEFEGAYSKKKKTLILTVVNRMQAVRLKNFVHTNDKGAFMVISTSSDVIGKGFRTPMMVKKRADFSLHAFLTLDAEKLFGIFVKNLFIIRIL